MKTEDKNSPAAASEFQPLDRAQDIYRQIFDYSVVPTIIHDLEMKIIEVNDSAVRLFGYAREEFLTKSIYDLHTTSELGHSSDVLDEMHHRETMSVRSSFKRKDGVAFYAQATPTRCMLGNKPIIHVFIQDVTSQVETEMRAKAYVEELEQFIRIASHDLNEPLRTINSFVELLADEYEDQLGADGAKYLGFVSAASIRMRELVKSLLGYSRLGRHEPLKEIHCEELVNAVLADLRRLISETDAAIHVGKLPILVGYEAKLRVLVQNLVANAIHHSKPGVRPKIEISARDDDKHWELAIADNGIGIEPGSQEKIFLVFQRLSSTADSERTGMGLASCRKIARMHGGDITVDSKPGQGSTFRLTISKQLH